MRLQDITSSRPAAHLGLFIAQHTPPRVGYGLARLAAGFIVRRRATLYRTVRANLRQILTATGRPTDDATLDALTYRLFFHAGQTYYDFFHVVNRPVEALADAVRLPPGLTTWIRDQAAQGRGVLLLGTHMSNFDLVGLTLGAHRLSFQVLSLPNPTGGFQFLNRLRERAGFEVTPITPESLMAAVRRLRHGGMVITGLDRPEPQERNRVEFFGRPAPFPTGPARMALLTKAMVAVGSCRYEPDEGYILDATWPVEMVRTGDRQQDILTNTRRLAAIVERYVAAHPEQWMMFHPVWPDE